MQQQFKPRLDILPEFQRAMWGALAPSIDLDFVLYGGTAVALRLGHRTSLDFDFFRAEALNKDQIRDRFAFMGSAKIVQDALNTLVVSAGRTQVSFFGGISIGRITAPSLTEDGILFVASPEDLLATKLKAILDRAEVKDYIDIAGIGACRRFARTLACRFCANVQRRARHRSPRDRLFRRWGRARIIR
jgi:hypothetical protein